MEIEKQRGISVATLVMGFEYQLQNQYSGYNQDTRTLLKTLTVPSRLVDSVIIVVVDTAKGVETQTRKLMKFVEYVKPRL